jgi:hypothetical protein
MVVVGTVAVGPTTTLVVVVVADPSRLPQPNPATANKSTITTTCRVVRTAHLTPYHKHPLQTRPTPEANVHGSPRRVSPEPDNQPLMSGMRSSATTHTEAHRCGRV